MTAIARFDAGSGEALETAIGVEHAEPVPAALSVLPRKRVLFSVDGYFRDGWDDLLSTAPDPWTLLRRHALLLLKPQAVAGRRLGAALEWLREQDAAVAAAEPVALDRHGVRAMWRYRWNAAARERRDLAERLMAAGEGLLLVVRLSETPVPATLRLSDLAGPADPARREPWHLRWRLDEDGALDGLLDLVHTSEEPADLVRELGVLLDGPARRRVYADLAAGADRRAEAAALVERLYRSVPEHDLSRDRAEERRARGEAVDPWDAALLAGPPESPRTPLLPGVTLAQWEHAGRRPLRRDRALPGALVHKEGLGEVFLSDHLADGSGGFLLAGELPAAHRFYNDLPSPRLDILPVLELCRQASYVVAHAHYGVPLDVRFLLGELSGRLTADPERSRRRVRIEAHAAGPSSSGMTLDFRVTAPDGAELATARTALSWIGEEDWRALRAEGRARHGLGEEVGAPDRTGLFPSARNVGRTHDGNVVLADLAWRRGETTARVAADPANPALFGDTRDRVPEPVLLEAARQAALWTMSRHFGLPAGRLAVAGLDARFTTVAELDARLSCTATVAADRGGKGAVAVRFVQDGVSPAEVMTEVVRT